MSTQAPAQDALAARIAQLEAQLGDVAQRFDAVTHELEVMRVELPGDMVYPTAPKGVPNLLEFGALGNGSFDNTTAINKAIASLPKKLGAGENGGLIYAPPGIYVHSGTINLKGFTGVRIIGASGLYGAGALGVGASNGCTSFVYTGAGARAWDFRSSVGCGLENLACLATNEAFAGFIWDMEGTVAEPTAVNHFINAVVEAARSPGGLKLIIPAAGLNLAHANGCKFDHCFFSGCTFGVVGRAAAAVESVQHHFLDCWFIGSQHMGVLNPDDSWKFTNCTAEALFNNKGENLKEAGFIRCEAGIPARGLTLDTCWSSSNAAGERKGINVEFRGDGLVVTGGEYGNCEAGFFLPEGPKSSSISGVRFKQCVNGMAITGKTIDSLVAFNKYIECTGEGGTGFTDTVKERKGSIVQIANEAALLVS